MIDLINSVRDLVLALGKLGPWGVFGLIVVALLPIVWLHSLTF